MKRLLKMPKSLIMNSTADIITNTILGKSLIYSLKDQSLNSYVCSFKSSDGTSREEDGYDDENEKLAVNGTISWISQDGSTYHMFFKADNKGFRPIIKRVPPVNKI